MADYSNKQRIDLPGPTSTKLPIRAAFIIEPPSRTAPIVLGRMTVADACMSFVGNSFALDPSDTILARGRLEQASVLARSIPVFGLSYPRDYARLPEVRQAILDQVASLDAL